MPQEPHADGGTVDEERLEMMRALWGDILGLATVPDDTNFYDLGGDSLLLVTLVEHIRQSTGVAVRTIDVLRAGTVRGHAQLLAIFGSTP